MKQSEFEYYEDDEYENEASPLDPFFEDGWISEVVREVKSGKEAKVYCCKPGPRVEVETEFVAAKVYLARERRNFRNDAMYQEGRHRKMTREVRAMLNSTKFGKQVHTAMWTEQEYFTLSTLYNAGASVPQPFKRTQDAVLMEFIGDENGPAPQLNSVALHPEEARPLFDRMMQDIQLWLSLNFVHGDLSPFNILYHNGKLTVIDFPQSTDPRFNNHAYNLLHRDIENLCRFWGKFGVQANANNLAGDLWAKFTLSQL